MLRLFFVAGLVSFAACASAGEKPNVLFIAIDDLNDWVGPLAGHPMAQTPAMDRLAKRGTTFTNAHCQSPLCNPSRTSLMTGLRPSSTGVYGLAPWFRDLPEMKPVVSLPQHFRNNGYEAATGGKIYHGGANPRKLKNEFDVIGRVGGVGVKPPKKLVDTPAKHPLVDWGVFDHVDEDKGDYGVASWAVEQIQRDHEKPFFLAAGFFLPHVPCYATQKWFNLYPNDESVIPEILKGDRADTPRYSWYLHWKLPEPRRKFLVDDGEQINIVRSYLACISFVDAQVGRILDALEASGHADNTVVVLWSDHGWHLGEKDITGKNTLWSESTRVPLIFAGPGVAENANCAQPAELLDMYPTLTELCGLPKPPQGEGLSLVPQLEEASTKRDRPAITTHNRNNHGVASQQWRYITYADGTQELYDREADPNEWKNLVADKAGLAKYADVVAEHRQWLPDVNLKPAPGSAHRILTRDDETGEVIWEGNEIQPGDPIPELQ